MSRKTTPALVLVALGSLAACRGPSPGPIATGDPAPDFSLPAADGSIVHLDEYLGEAPILLYFNMAYG